MSADLQRFDVLAEPLVEAGLTLEQIVVDLDETVWEWAMPLLRQPWLVAHTETVFPRQPLLRLLAGLPGRLNAWTAGYGYRLDAIAEQEPLLQKTLALTCPSEEAPNVVTRLDFVTAWRADPDAAIRRQVAQKYPGYPSAAGKPDVDAARILVDDKETNCRRFVNAGDGRSAIWLHGSARKRSQTMPLWKVRNPEPREWASAVAEAFASHARGEPGLFVANPRPSQHAPRPVRVVLPHRVAWRDFVLPAREVKAHS